MLIKLKKGYKTYATDSELVFKILREELQKKDKVYRDKEHFWTFSLDTRNKIIAIELTCLGSKKSVFVEAMEVFNFAIRSRAAQIMVAHNHPSGVLKPSNQDKDLTERFCAVGRLINIPLIDHVIVTEKKYYSFFDSGLLFKLMQRHGCELTLENLDRLNKTIKYLRALNYRLSHP